MRQRTRTFLTLLGLALAPWPGPAGARDRANRLVTFTAALRCATRTIAVLPAPLPGELIVNGGFESGAVGWEARDVRIGAAPAGVGARSGQGVAWFSGWQDGTPEVLRQTVRIPPGAGPARLTYWLHIENHGDIPGALDSFTVKARAADGRLAILDTSSNLDGDPGFQRRSVDLGAYRGQAVELSFIAQDSPLGVNTAFTLDDVSLVAQ